MLVVKPKKCENCPFLQACSKSGKKMGRKERPSGVSKSVPWSQERSALVAVSEVGPGEPGLGQTVRPRFYSNAAQEQRFEPCPGFSSPRLGP